MNTHALRLPSADGSPMARLAGVARMRPRLRAETLIAGTSAYFALCNNTAFWHAAVDHPLRSAPWALALLVLVFAANAVLLSAIAWHRLARPAIAAMLLVSALASHYTRAYGIHIDADMVRNVLHTDPGESAEFVSAGLLASLLWAVPPLLVLWRVRLRPTTPAQAIVRRLAFLAGIGLLALVAALGCSRNLSALLRNHREVRYLVNPANVVVSLAKLVTEDAGRPRQLEPVAQDAMLLPRAMGAKPRLLVLVVGETARAANWGLNGYARQTTPRLARTPGVVNFPDVTACGTSTEVALPCMFSPYGRERYDRDAIRGHESILHLLAHAGVSVLWRDNQSGCKGVCDGLAVDRPGDARDPVFCDAPRCRDGVLLSRPESWLGDGRRDRVVVLHMLGNHGPSYRDRYPPPFQRYRPVCASADLGRCSRQQIVNAYDNALLYTDHLLATTIELLRRQPDYDAALLYVSDHGESLGENGLYLHGFPWAIAPREQVQVPMVAWLSPGFASATGIDTGCLSRHATRPVSHDHLFHSLLGAMDVSTREYRAERDVFAPCRPAGRVGRLAGTEARA
ncbi:phosphoethanolamine transferase [Luteimonas saliphila]|uniref:phosphoethanolamine transferase n=1 Tax=Luteimonas saliphila TaxID=2804919 RepID=UPI00192DA404|nr:phosphoethanolamine--lipid A transferase [Luteimonas saliphila]